MSEMKLTNAALTVVGKCPRCGKNVIDKGASVKKYACESNRFEKRNGEWVRTAGCGFELWKTCCGKKLPGSSVKALLERGRTSKPVYGLKSKAGKGFSAILVLDADSGKIGFEFDNYPRGSKGTWKRKC